MMLGDRIRELRKSRQMTITTLAAKTNMSESYISQMESGKAEPSVSMLRRLASALDVPIAAFFDDEGELPVIMRKGERRVEAVGAGESTVSFLTKQSDDLRMEIKEITVAPMSTVTFQTPKTHCCMMVETCSVDITLPDVTACLNKGDSMYLPANVMICLANTSENTAEALFCTSRPEEDHE